MQPARESSLSRVELSPVLVSTGSRKTKAKMGDAGDVFPPPDPPSSCLHPFFKLPFFKNRILCVGCTCRIAHVEVRGQLVDVGFLPPDVDPGI